MSIQAKKCKNKDAWFHTDYVLDYNLMEYCFHRKVDSQLPQ